MTTKTVLVISFDRDNNMIRTFWFMNKRYQQRGDDKNKIKSKIRSSYPCPSPMHYSTQLTSPPINLSFSRAYSFLLSFNAGLLGKSRTDCIELSFAESSSQSGIAGSEQLVCNSRNNSEPQVGARRMVAQSY